MKHSSLSLLLPGLLLASCASTPNADKDRMFFNVAMMPVEVVASTTEAASDWKSDEEDAKPSDEGDIVVDFDSMEFSASMRDALDGIFTNATLLEGSEEWSALPAQERDEQWLAAARASDADMIVEATLTYNPNVDSDIRYKNKIVYYTLPVVTLLLAALPYYVPDREYTFRKARLDIRLHDVNAMTAATGATLSNNRAVVYQTILEFESTQLNLIERGGGTHYLYGLLVPSPYLATDTEKAARNLNEQVTEKFYADTQQNLLDAREVILASSGVAPFHLADLAVEDGRLTGRVRLASTGATRLDSYVIEAGATKYFDAYEEVEGYLEYPIDEAIAPGVDHVRVTVVDGNQIPRSFTVPVGDRKVDLGTK